MGSARRDSARWGAVAGGGAERGGGSSGRRPMTDQEGRPARARTRRPLAGRPLARRTSRKEDLSVSMIRANVVGPVFVLPPMVTPSTERNRAEWKSWQEGLSVRMTLPKELPPLRMLVVWDNLVGHVNAELLLWMFVRGIMVLYTPLGGSWLNMAESIQRILAGRALSGEHPRRPEQIIEWLEATARGWNRDPTPFEWGGRRAERRARARKRRHSVGGSGACARRPIRRRRTIMEKWRCS